LFWDPAGREVLDRVRAKKELAGRIVAEFCGFGGRRISLESLGLVTVSYESRGWQSLLEQLRRELPDAVAEHAPLSPSAPGALQGTACDQRRPERGFRQR